MDRKLQGWIGAACAAGLVLTAAFYAGQRSANAAPKAKRPPGLSEIVQRLEALEARFEQLGERVETHSLTVTTEGGKVTIGGDGALAAKKISLSGADESQFAFLDSTGFGFMHAGPRGLVVTSFSPGKLELFGVKTGNVVRLLTDVEGMSGILLERDRKARGAFAIDARGNSGIIDSKMFDAQATKNED